jgi:hypothetical protein
MRKWETVLSRDSDAYDDHIAWLRDHRDRELDKLRRVDSASHERQAGRVDGIEMILFLVEQNRKERLSNASR